MCKFSVIVPVYNLEKYINKCVESVLTQTYKNFELILINDGSTDSSREILEKIDDKRVKIIDKQNGGAACARNAGIENANGEYIVFVDGDDRIDKKYLEIVNHVLEDSNAKILLMSLIRANENNEEQIKYTFNFKQLSKIEAMEKMLYQKELDTGVIGKIFHKTIFEQKEFLKGCLYEDIDIIFDLIEKTNDIVYLEYTGYLYTIRKESTTLKKFEESKMQLIEICKKNREKYAHKYPMLINAFDYRILESMLHLFFQSYLVDKKIANDLWNEIVKNRTKVLCDVKVKMRTKTALLISFLGKNILYKAFCFTSNRKIGNGRKI